MKFKIETKKLALVSVFAALLVIISRLPGIPIMGGAGKIEFTVILAPIVGVVLGPWLGGLTVLLGDFIAWLIPSTTFFGLLFLPCGAIAAIVSGTLARKDKAYYWKVAVSVLGVLNVLWYLTPPGREVFFYPFLHWAAFILVLFFRKRIADFIQSDIKQKLTLGITLCCFAGIMANHMAGNLIFIASVGWFIPLKTIKDAVKALGFFWMKSGLPSPEDFPSGLGALFTLMLPISVVERISMTIIATFLGSGIVFALQRSGLIKIGEK